MVTFDYERMFNEATMGLAAISEALEISDEDDTGGAGPAIDYIEAMKSQVADLKKTIQNALSELKAGDVRSAIDQLEAGNE